MPAEVYENDIVAYAAGSEIPWHRTNCVEFDPDAPLREQWDKTSLNFEVCLEDLAMADGRLVNHRAVVRTDNRDVLGVVGPQWQPMQPRRICSILEQLVDEKIIRLHTAGTLRNGGRMWAQCEIVGHQSTFEIVPGDFLRRFYSIAQGLDGLLGVHAGFTDWRTVCANTLRASLEDARSRFVRIKHNRLVVDNVKDLIAAIDWESQELRLSIEKYKFLASKGVSRADLRKYVRLVLDVHLELDWDDLPTRSQNIVRSVEDLFEAGKGNDLPGARGTWWAGYNAVTEYLSHKRGRTADNRLDYNMFGAGRAVLEKALDVAVTMADVSAAA